MELSWDETKRAWTKQHRGLDFADVNVLFEGRHAIRQDTRRDYGEVRWVVVGFLHRRLMVAAYTMRGDTYHVFSFRKANDREQKIFEKLCR